MAENSNSAKGTDLDAEWESFEKLIEGPVPSNSTAGLNTIPAGPVPAPVPAVGSTMSGIPFSEATVFSGGVGKGSLAPIFHPDDSGKAETEKQSAKDSSDSESESEKSDSDDSSDSSEESATSSDHSSSEKRKKGKNTKESSDEESDESDSDEDEKDSTSDSSSSEEDEPVEIKPASRVRSDSGSKDEKRPSSSRKSSSVQSKRKSRSPVGRSHRRSSSPSRRRDSHHHRSKHSHSSRHKHRRSSGHRSHRSRSRDKRRRRRSHSRSRSRRKRSRSSGRRRKHRRSRSSSSERGYRRRRHERRRRSRSPHHSRTFAPQHRQNFKDTRPEKKTLTYKETLRQKLLEAQKQASEGKLDLSNADSGDLMTLNEKPSALPLKTIHPLMSLQTGPTDKVTPQQALIQTMAAMHQKAQQLTGVAVPKYYNPAAVNPLKFAEQVKKRKLLWSKKEDAGEGPPAPSAAPVESTPSSSSQAGNAAALGTSAVKQWQGTAFIQDDDGKVAAKFRKLMGIKSGEAAAKSDVEDKNPEAQEQIRKQQMLFQQLDREYEFARMTTHTHRGVGLGFSSQGFPEQK